MSKRLRVVTVADEKYLDYLKTFLNSAKVNLERAIIEAWMVNVDPSVEDELKSINPRVRCHFEKRAFANPMQTRCFCTNWRGDLLLKHLRNTNDIIMWLDADAIIRKPSYDELHRLGNTCDISMRLKVTKQIGKGFMGGLILLGNTSGSMRFAKLYNRKLSNEKFSYLKVPSVVNGGDLHKIPPRARQIWMSNQNLLFVCYNTVRKLVKFKPLPFKFLDTRFLDDGHIWTVKTSTRRDPKFNKESRKYDPTETG